MLDPRTINVDEKIRASLERLLGADRASPEFLARIDRLLNEGTTHSKAVARVRKRARRAKSSSEMR